MPNGQQVPPPQQQASLVTHDIAPGREIGYFTGTGQRGGTTTAGGTFYSISGQSEDMLFRTPAEAQQYATSKGTPITSQVGVSDVPSSVYWQQKTAREEAAKSAYGGVRTPAALGEVGKPVAGSQLEAKVKFLERGTAQFASEAQFTKTAEEVGRITPVSAKGIIVTPGFRTGEEQLKAMEPTITPTETQKITLPPTPRETTEAFMKRISVGGGLVEPQIFKVREGSIVSQYFYTPGAEFKDVFGGRTPIKPGMLYTRDIFGFTTERPISEVPAMKQATQREAEIIKTTETIAGTGLGMGFGEAFTTSSMIRGAKLIQPGDVAAIQRSIKSLSPKMPSGFAEFIRSEEAAVTFGRERPIPKPRSLATTSEVYSQIRSAASKQILEPPKTVSRVEPSKAQEYTLIMPEKLESILEPRHVQVPYYSSKGTMAGSIDVSVARMRSVYASTPSPAKSIEEQRAILTEYFGELKQPSKTSQITQQAQTAISATRQISLQQQLQKSLLLPVSIYKQVSIQRQEATTKQIAKQRTILTPIEIGITRQITPQIPKQIQRQYQITPQIPIQRTVTPVPTIPTVPTTTTPTFTPPDITPYIPPYTPPKTPPETPPITPPDIPPWKPTDMPPDKPFTFPFPDFQVYPTRKKGKKKAKGERILKLYPIGAAENVLSSLGMGTKKRSKRKHKKK